MTSLRVENNQQLEILRIPNMRSTLTIKDNQYLKSANFPELQMVGPSFVISNNPSLKKINGFPKLEQIDGSVDVTGTFSEFELSKLNEIKGGINVQTKSKRFKCEEIYKLKNEDIIKGDTIICLSGISDPKSIVLQPKSGIVIEKENKGTTNTSAAGTETLLNSDVVGL
ncbi:16246_t:CDS:2 [Racocetra fulgida]|uniref:16246_t:CDS:1 n=1 Tax=Racocetra fulgida TaxID=60492 RepID=A0A9N9CEG0_9GLOM|nr:16246_t:CDS:2 [Racocetra fulgida]